MSSVSSPSTTPGSETPQAGTAELWRGVLIGFLPLGLLVVSVAAAIALTAGVRAVVGVQDFAREQLAVVLTLGIGLALGIIGYVIAIVRVWRRMTAWRLAGTVRQATGALWALAVTALIVLLPVVLALVISQHPAP